MTNGQKWETGLRLGGRYDNINYSAQNEASINIEPSLFLKRILYRRFSAEFSLSYFKVHTRFPNRIYNQVIGQEIEDGTYHFRENIFYTTVGVTYNIIDQGRLLLNVAGGIANRHGFKKMELCDNTQPSQSFFGEERVATHILANTIYVGSGANYNLAKRLFLNCNVRVETISSELFRIDNTMYIYGPSFIPTFHAGLGYKF